MKHALDTLLVFFILSACADARVTPSRLRKVQLGLLAENSSHQHQSFSMKTLQPYYHTSDEIAKELSELSGRCQGMSVKSVQGTSDDGRTRSVQVVEIRKPGTEPRNKNFLLFGEHSRELISPESGLHFIKSLCGETDLAERAQDVLKDSEFQIVVNGNAASRRKVEQGDFCLRTNPEGVDLNRNWDERWSPNSPLDPKDTNPGPQPFSEPETRVFKQLVEEYRPSTFLTVHSGTRGMYMPWAFDMEHLADRNQPQMMQILRSLDKDHCQCPFGAAGKEVGYPCPGTCLDWVYDRLQTPYVFAFEIYAGPEWADMLKERWEEKMSAGGEFFQIHSHLGHEHFHDLFVEHPADFVQLKQKSARRRGGMSEAECFAQFNPGSEGEYNSLVENWSAAYLDMSALVASQLKQGTDKLTNSTSFLGSV